MVLPSNSIKGFTEHLGFSLSIDRAGQIQLDAFLYQDKFKNLKAQATGIIRISQMAATGLQSHAKISQLFLYIVR